MPITFYIPSPLREFTGGRSEVQIAPAPASIGAALTVLWTQHPGLRDRIVNEQGNVREHLNIFVGEENIRYTGGLATPVSDGATVTIVPAVSGGNG
ncbi:MAG: MoaD/ThiS family protein [Acidobacteria bacterium]|nr:MoaD/ThiS family protein [Acidobacteriota bacterium]